MEKIYYCYKATNDMNGKTYIGFASNPQTRWRNHKRDAETGRGYAFHDAIRKYGWEHFHFEVICGGKDKRTMLEYVEPSLIEQYHSSIDENGYNILRKPVMAPCNFGRKPLTEEQLIRHHERAKDPNIRHKISEALKGNKNRLGRHHVVSETSRLKMQISNRGKGGSDKQREITSERMKGNQYAAGRTLSEEQKKKLSDAMKNRDQSYKRKPHTIEHRRRISEGLKGNTNRCKKAVC